MGVAVGTSLVIIAVKSLAGFAKNWDQLGIDGIQISWTTILLFVVAGGLGTLLGDGLGRRLPQQRLRQVFAVFLVVMGIAILLVTGPKVIQRDTAAASSGDGAAAVVE